MLISIRSSLSRPFQSYASQGREHYNEDAADPKTRWPHDDYPPTDKTAPNHLRDIKDSLKALVKRSESLSREVYGLGGDRVRRHREIGWPLRYDLESGDVATAAQNFMTKQEEMKGAMEKLHTELWRQMVRENKKAQEEGLRDFKEWWKRNQDWAEKHERGEVMVLEDGVTGRITLKDLVTDEEAPRMK